MIIIMYDNEMYDNFKGGFRPENFESMFSRQRLTQKLHPLGQLFGRVLRPQPLWRHVHFHAKKGISFKKASKHDFSQPIDR